MYPTECSVALNCPDRPMTMSVYCPHCENVIQTAPSLTAVISLLRTVGLPWDDLRPADMCRFLYAGPERRPSGVIGYEVHGEHGLLRSLAVHPDQRNKGLGGDLLVALEQHAWDAGVRNLYLLTEGAHDYFSHRFFRQIARNQAPQPIQQSSQFSLLCPASARLMVKSL